MVSQLDTANRGINRGINLSETDDTSPTRKPCKTNTSLGGDSWQFELWSRRSGVRVPSLTLVEVPPPDPRGSAASRAKRGGIGAKAEIVSALSPDPPTETGLDRPRRV